MTQNCIINMDRTGLTKENLPFDYIIGLKGNQVEFENVNIKNNKLLKENFLSGAVSANDMFLMEINADNFIYKKGVISGNNILSGAVIEHKYGTLHLEDAIVENNKISYGDKRYHYFAEYGVFNHVTKAKIYNSRFSNNISYSKGTCFSNTGAIWSFNSVYDGNKVTAKKKNATRKNPIPPIGLFGVLAHAIYDDGSKAEAEGALFSCGRLYLNSNKIINNYSEGGGILASNFTYYIGVNNLIANNTAKLGGVLTAGSAYYIISINETYKNNDGIGLPVLAQLSNGLFLNTILDNGNTAIAYRYKNEGVFYYINNALNTNRLPETASDYRIKNVALSDASNTMNFPLSHENTKQAISKVLTATRSFSYGMYDEILSPIINDKNSLSNNTEMPIGSQIK